MKYVNKWIIGFYFYIFTPGFKYLLELYSQGTMQAWLFLILFTTIPIIQYIFLYPLILAIKQELNENS